MSAAFIFGLLIALMLTGMPISIALGLTVLTFMYTMTQVPIEAVALKLFSGIDSFEIMAIPFFILAGNFLTHGGVARRMIRFATCYDRPLVWRPRPRRRHGLRAVRRGVGLLARDRRRHRLDHHAGDGEAGLSQTLRRRRHRHLGRARHPDPALDRDGAYSRSRPAAAWRSIRTASAFCPPRSASCSWPASSPGSCWPACSASPRSTARGRTTIRACRRRPGPKACRRSAIRCGGWRSSSS